MGAKVTVDGLDELRQALAGVVRDVETGARRAVKESLAEIRSDARADVPVDEGRLRDGIEADVDSSGLSGRVAVFGEASSYGPFVEFGTSSRPARPYMTPAAERERRRFPERVADEVKKALG